MLKLIAPARMREYEARYFKESGVKSIDAMERAASALAKAVSGDFLPGARVYCACGTGGNGGDGTACARLLKKRYSVTIIQPSLPRTPDAIENLRRAQECGIPVLESANGLPEPDAWIDALFGTGLGRAPSGAEAALIDRMNASPARVFSADIPSGLNGETGVAFPHCVRADRTITFGFAKPGLFLQDGLDCAGRVTVDSIGFPDSAFASDALLLQPSDVAGGLPPRPRNIYKNLCGHLLVVAGSFGMAGAAMLAAKAAMRTGVGLVTIACPRSIVPILQSQLPGAMCVPLDEADGAIAASAVPELTRAFAGKTAAIVGCGLSTRASAEVVRAVLESDLPAVIDADALNLCASNDLFRLLGPRHVVTPHPGEAARLLKASFSADSAGLSALLNDPIAAAHALRRRFGESGPCVLYKGASCVITDGEHTYVSASGCCGMARGGSGDALSGIIGALLAERSDRSTALSAALGSELHGLAGEHAQQKLGSRGMVAGDIPDFLNEVLPR